MERTPTDSSPTPLSEEAPLPRCDGESRPTDFERFLRHAAQVEREQPLSLRAWLDLAEIWRITQALRECGGNRSAAARRLGIGRRTLYAKMEKLGITPSWSVRDPS